MVLAVIRYKSVVGYDRSWNLNTNELCCTTGYVKLIWGVSFMIAIPPLFGFGSYKLDVGAIRYYIHLLIGCMKSDIE